jgi:putative Mg2+ transporter-C (MgtC) family protein
MVSLGCCLFTLVGIWISDAGDGIVHDPGRIPAQIVTGIGFLGGGAIFRSAGAVKGLTTAASIWMVAAIGMACGSGFYLGAGIGTGGGLLILTVFERLESRFVREKLKLRLRIVVKDPSAVERIRVMVERSGIQVDSFHVAASDSGEEVLVDAKCSSKLVAALSHTLFSDSQVVLMERTLED